MSRHTTARVAGAAVMLVLTASPEALADAKSCVRDHAAGLDAARSAELQGAKKLYLACAVEDCPTEIRDECIRLSQDVSKRLPSVVIAARGADGRDIVAARVLVDGIQVAARMDGGAIELNPGVREIEVQARDGGTKRRVVVREGEKGRLLEFRFGSERPTSPRRQDDTTRESTSGDSATPPLAWVAGGVGVLSIGAFGYFALTGQEKERELESCSPYCSQGEYDAMKRRYLFADVALGIGVVALGAATVIVLASDGESPTRVVGVAVTPQSARLQWTGAL